MIRKWISFFVYTGNIQPRFPAFQCVFVESPGITVSIACRINMSSGFHVDQKIHIEILICKRVVQAHCHWTDAGTQRI
ncbi:hypothetical protein DSECCO2_664000 [anaerobic digester metagenome]